MVRGRNPTPQAICRDCVWKHRFSFIFLACVILIILFGTNDTQLAHKIALLSTSSSFAKETADSPRDVVDGEEKKTMIEEEIEGEDELEKFETQRSVGSDGYYDSPRTWKDPYNQIETSKRYFIYTSSGGFNNQRAILEYAIYISNILNRTLVIPMAGKHCQMWYKHEALTPEQLFPMDRILDIEFLTKVAINPHFLILNVSVPVFLNTMVKPAKLGVHTVFHPQSKSWKESNLLPFKSLGVHFLYFRGGEMYHKWGFPSSEMDNIQKHVRYTEAIRKLSMEVALGVKIPFNAVHIRLGDYTGRTPSSASFASRMEKYKFNKTEPVYIATEPTKDMSFFQAILDEYPTVYFSKDLPLNKIKAFKSIFPRGQIQNDMLGIVEQLVCVIARRFVPTDFSTFSAWINTMRKNREFAFPESVEMRTSPKWRAHF